eukprot:CAMPEP_0197870168 /NCGR_PEP_ID=MMETSP1439-20131203/922_1 /TAXON_ID=66791 /ORGANISM="Gonyaulax spinifera, Strain CCMP409" /LENGTH=32 /DNA_ID= /DNA_START= /DNA_END= /DNA_ORIENTATION=
MTQQSDSEACLATSAAETDIALNVIAVDPDGA